MSLEDINSLDIRSGTVETHSFCTEVQAESVLSQEENRSGVDITTTE